MVSSISGTSTYQYQSKVQDTTLTDDQKDTLQDIISQYDPDTITADQQKEMMDKIKDAGIKPSKEFGEIMNQAGFKPPEKPQDSSDTSSTSSTSSTSQTDDNMQQLLSLLSNQDSDSSDSTTSSVESFINSLKNSGSSLIGSLINQTA